MEVLKSNKKREGFYDLEGAGGLVIGSIEAKEEDGNVPGDTIKVSKQGEDLKGDAQRERLEQKKKKGRKNGI